MSNWNDTVITNFRESNGKEAGRFPGSSLLILHTVGAKSGEPREAPMMYFTDGDGVYVIASKAGTPENPAWYHNLVAHPEVTVERGTADGILKYDAIATPVERARRDELWAKFTQRAPGFAGYQEKTERIIPVVEITPR